MKKKTNENKVSTFRSVSRFGGGIIVIGLLLLTVLTVLSMQGAFSSKNVEAGPSNNPALNGPKQRPFVTINAQGNKVVLDRQTNEERELSQEESRRLAEGLKQILNNSTDGLVEVAQKDGTVSIDLKGHFHNAMVVRKEADGTLTHSCINDLKAASAFFDIDPSLLGLEGPVTKFKPTKAEER